jgi:ATPase family AAA domain-containing protein 3A/B
MGEAKFEPQLEARLAAIAKSAAHTKKNGAPFRHCLFHGPPGTGKTLFAKKLAKHAGLDYAIASGGDVAPLGRDAVTEIHKLFDWAKTSGRGVVLLLDEAEAFVRARDRGMSEDARNALNAFLFRTGSPSESVMVVFASNTPQLFDKAIYDRTDEIVHFDLPREAERRAILADCVADMVKPQPARGWFRPAPAPLVVADDVDEAALDHAAKRTAGLSAREIVKLANAWRAHSFATEAGRLTRAIFDETIEHQLAQTEVKRAWHARSVGDLGPLDPALARSVDGEKAD